MPHCRNNQGLLVYYVGTRRSGWYIMSEHTGTVDILYRNTQERLLVYYGVTPRTGWYIMSNHAVPFAFYYQDVEILFQLISNRR